jgi:hypothetical protein
MGIGNRESGRMPMNVITRMRELRHASIDEDLTRDLPFGPRPALPPLQPLDVEKFLLPTGRRGG